MTQTQFAPPETDRTDVDIGLAVEDQRNGALAKVVYADDRVVLARDESGYTTLTPRDTFLTELGSRYRPRPAAEPDVEGGPFERVRTRLAEYDGADGRKASHKAAALREALALADGSGPGEEAASDDAAPDDRHASAEIAYEDFPGVGPETAAALRTAGFVSEADVRAAPDEALLGVAGVGPTTLAAVREALEA